MYKKTLDELLEQWEKRRRAAGRKRIHEGSALEQLAHTAAASSEGTVTQGVIDRWVRQRDSEKDSSYSSRLGTTLPFLRYVVQQYGYTRLAIPEVHLDTSHVSTDRSVHVEELDNLFLASCEFEGTSIRQRLTRIEFPVMVRLMLSAGLRPNEARMLRLQDVDLNDGIVDIINTKGYVQHQVVLHDSMLTLLRRYDGKVRTLVPARKAFFPTPEGSFQNPRWLNTHFRKAWTKYNSGNATSYLLRHDYATRNVNRIDGADQEESLRKLQALQRSMGHTSMESTMGYYNERAGFSHALERHDMDKEDILPSLTDTLDDNEY